MAELSQITIRAQIPLLNGLKVKRAGSGRPRSRPQAVVADKAYSHPSTR